MKTDSMINTITDAPLNQSLVELEEMKTQSELLIKDLNGQRKFYSRPAELGLIDSEVTLTKVMQALPANSTCYMDFYEGDGAYQYPQIQALNKFRSGLFKFEKGLVTGKGLITYFADGCTATAGYNSVFAGDNLSHFSGVGGYVPRAEFLQDSNGNAKLSNIFIFGVVHDFFRSEVAAFVDMPSNIDVNREAQVVVQSGGYYAHDRRVITVTQLTSTDELKEWRRLISNQAATQDSGWHEFSLTKLV